MNMNFDQMTGVIRAVVPAALAYAVGKGWIPAGAVGDITAAVVAIAAAMWSIQNNASGKTIT
jgi:hypothetical protein